MIGVVDYGLGNVQAILNIYSRLGIPAMSARDGAELEGCERFILPGVGSFDWAMQRLDASGMRGVLERLVMEQGRPVLGICVGFQMMARSSEEGRLPGLGWIGATVRRLEESRLSSKARLPHMGWNDVVARRDSSLFAQLERPMRFYFLHSYYFAPDRADDVLAETDYGGSFCSAAEHGSACGVQFHPEKSHGWGVGLLRNFAGGSACSAPV